MLWTRVCDRVTGLARGKAAGSTFLSFPMVKGGVRDKEVFEVPLPPNNFWSCV